MKRKNDRKIGIKLFCDGKENPYGICGDYVRLSVKTENVYAEKIYFYIYRSKNDYKSKKIFTVLKSDTYFTYFKPPHKGKNRRFYWNAIIKSANNLIESPLSFFETGIAEDKLQAKWITNGNFNGSVSEFVKEFVIEKKPLVAKLYIVCLGAYSSCINDIPTDDNFYKPILTDFEKRKGLNSLDYNEKNFSNSKKRIPYDVFDVTDSIKIGANVFKILLGTGWYYESTKCITDPPFYYGKPKLCFELHLTFNDAEEKIFSDYDVKVRNTSRISNVIGGEFFDFTALPESFINVKLCKKPDSKLVYSPSAHDRIEKHIFPEELFGYNVKGRLFDFGINHSGGLNLKIKGPRGSKLTVKYYEIAEGKTLNPYTSRWVAYNIKTGVPQSFIDQKDEYVLSGEIDEIYPLFHWNCYRYAEIIGENYEIISLESLFIHTDIREDGFFSCDYDFFNKLYSAYVVTQKDNIHCGVTSDCPHREKLPYTGDGMLIAPAMLYSFDAEGFFLKWLDDIILSQGNDGWIPYTAPYLGGAGGYWWCNALPSVAENLYNFSGDKEVLKKCFIPLEKYLRYCDKQHDGDYVIKRTSVRCLIGEWLTPFGNECCKDYINTAAYYYAVVKAKEFAEILNYRTKEKKYSELANKIKIAINQCFYNERTSTYAEGKCGENALALYYGFCPEEYASDVKNALVDRYRNTKRFDTGIIITPILLNYLTENCEEDLAFDLMTATGYPSFSYMLDGETTLREYWGKTWQNFNLQDKEIEGNGEISHCHPMFGSVVTWLYKYVAGLNLDELYRKRIIYSPKYINRVKTARAEKITSYGKASIEYENTSLLTMKIIVPFGVTGILKIEYLAKRTVNLIDNSKKSKVLSSENEIVLPGGEYTIIVS